MNYQRLTEVRHWLHAHPELSRQETGTARYLRKVLMSEARPDQMLDLDGAGFAAVYCGARPGKTVMLRCELDALPIAEANSDLPYLSSVPGIGHKCGHDGHMAMLLGVGFVLAQVRPVAGRVVLVFQPDEETGTGAQGCVEHPSFQDIQPDLVFALHNLPGVPFGQIVCRTGPFASAVHYEAVRFHGRPAHSSLPQTGVSPAKAIAELTLLTEDLAKNAAEGDGYALAVPIFTQMGVASSGVAPAAGELHVTLRSDRNAVVEKMLSALRQQAARLAQAHGLDVSFDELEKFSACVNDGQATTCILNAARALGKEPIVIREPFRWGEDFGAFTQAAQGAMFGLGAGTDVPPLHDETYDFPDTLIPEGTAMFLELIRSATLQNSA